jgi:hypothetical protein
VVNARQHDVTLDGKGFMLVRATRGGRSWHRRPVADVPGSAGPDETRFGNLPATLRFTEVFDDFSGGDGYPYRSTAPPNGVHWSENADLRWPGQAVHCQALLTVTAAAGVAPPVGVERLIDVDLPGVANPPGGAGAVQVLAGQILNGGQFAWSGNYNRYNYTPTGKPAPNEFTLINQAIADVSIVGKPAMFGSYYFFGAVSGNFIQMLRSGVADLSVTLPGQGFVAGGTRLWRVHGGAGRPHHLQSLAVDADPTLTANWSATLPVGNGISPVSDLIAFREQVFAGMPDGLYAGDQSGSFFNVTGELAGRVHPDNFRDLDLHEGEIVGVHSAGLFAYNPTTTAGARVRQINQPQRSARSPVVGQHRAVRSFGGWLYAGLWTGSASYLRAGREVSPGDWRWHTLNRLPHVSRVHRLHVDGITTASGGGKFFPNRLWVATDASINNGGLAGTAPLYYAPVPRDGQNPLALDPVFSANYAGSARVDLPEIDRNAPGVLKVWESVEVWSDAALSGHRYADVYYTADRGTRTLAGRVQTSPVTTVLLGSLNGSFVTGRALEVSLESFTDTSGCAPVYRAVVVRGRLLPKYVELIDAVVRASDGITDRYGTPMRPAAVIVDDLRAMADPLRDGGRPHQLVDLAGATSWVTLTMPTETEVWQQGIEEPELALNVQMAVMVFSVGA